MQYRVVPDMTPHQIPNDLNQNLAKDLNSHSFTLEFLPSVWYLLADRIFPQLCCRYPPPLYGLFLEAVREVSRQDGNLDLAVAYLQDIVTSAPSDGILFEQAGQLLNIIEWRRTCHPTWFPSGMKGYRLKPGKCSPYITHAMVLLQTGEDDEALSLAEKIINSSDPGSDDRWLAYLIRTAVFICMGEITIAEKELNQINVENSMRT
ncbi:MAG: hypothetical protein LUQ50_02310 [Methanospirillum sp.]|uniref:tetratricopeptide repeat protein n=1 Tax=Methanospirillum sp. TaxID=45200 RepID=UPI002374768D|nr:hypothetical protein [Methanospirillum sp.]MDD1727887.1 hypothetical protein [Methanospirillum sp.]